MFTGEFTIVSAHIDNYVNDGLHNFDFTYRLIGAALVPVPVSLELFLWWVNTGRTLQRRLLPIAVIHRLKDVALVNPHTRFFHHLCPFFYLGFNVYRRLLRPAGRKIGTDSGEAFL